MCLCVCKVLLLVMVWIKILHQKATEKASADEKPWGLVVVGTMN